ncbi:hypothetical protein [Hanstruepera ponticola]|uniref:hypothetical protein n=1 Tax=Hanstruepera ponticola TaxID=2042995 RepID=UPI0017803740|nr:hypothetical protein [Hanstruepera ponticola]
MDILFTNFNHHYLMINSAKKFLVLFFMLIGFFGFAQENSDEIHHHSISILLGHTTIFQGFENGERKTESEPSWAINYNYMFNDKWALGLHNDIIIENFVVEKTSGDEILERNTPITSLIVGTYKIFDGFGVELGGGLEFDKNESFGVARIGAEYGIEITKHNLEVLISLDYDIVIDAYDGLNIGIGIAKLF